MIKKNAIPIDIRRFVRANIPSVPHLEALMLLKATAPQRWCAASLATRLYVALDAAAAVLADLSQAGMLRTGPMQTEFWYSAGADELAGLIDRLAQLQATNLVGLTLLIHSKCERDE